MASGENDYFGFELLNRIYDSCLSKKEDVIVLFVHWYLVKNGFKCIGLGDSKVFDPKSERGTDFLPAEWNQGAIYSLRYVKDENLHILVAIKSDENLLINLLRVGDNLTSNVEFPIDDTVRDIHGPLDSLIPNHRTVVDGIRKDLVQPHLSAAGSAREISTQTNARAESPERRHPLDADPLRVRADPTPLPLRQPWSPRPGDVRNIGRSDLDPFSRDGGGMIFDPFSGQHGAPPGPFGPRRGLGVPGTLPPGAVPPGARFDPFGPPDIDAGPRRSVRDPDADHLPPPGYDDMFM